MMHIRTFLVMGMALCARWAPAQTVDQEIQKNIERFQQVPAFTSAATNRLMAVTLNRNPLIIDGERYDGVRFQVPAGGGRELNWGLQFPDHAEDMMWITPAQGEIRHEFSGITAETAWTRRADEQSGPAGTKIMFFTVHARRLPPGMMCVVWFHFLDAQPVRIPVSALFVEEESSLRLEEMLPGGQLSVRPPFTAGVRLPAVVMLPVTNADGSVATEFEERAEQALVEALATNVHVLAGAERRSWLAEHDLATPSDFARAKIKSQGSLELPTIFVLPAHDPAQPDSMNLTVSVSTSKGASFVNERVKPGPRLITDQRREELNRLVGGMSDDALAIPPPLADRAALHRQRLTGKKCPSFSVSIKEAGGAAVAQTTLVQFLKTSGCSAAPAASAGQADIELTGAGSTRPLATRDTMTASQAKIAVKIRSRATGAEVVLYQSAVVAGSSEAEAGRAAMTEAAIQLADRLMKKLAR